MALDQLGIDAPKGVEPEKEMTFFDHIEELRWHIMRSVAAILVFAIAAFVAKDFVFNTVIFGPRYPDFITYELFCNLSKVLGMGEQLCFFPTEFDLITPDMGELFMTHMKVSAVLGFVAAFPYIFWEVWKFVKPGLYEKEQRAARNAVGVCSFLFLFGVLFGYFLISPFSVSFLTGYQLPGVKATPSLGSYINYLIMFTLPTGLIFELPVAAHVLTKVGLISSDFMKQYRRYAVVVIFIVAAIITPPDVFSQMMIAVPLMGLYELSITVAKRVERQQALEEAAGA